MNLHLQKRTIFCLCVLYNWIKLEALRYYQQNIPNGEKVPHPCFIMNGAGYMYDHSLGEGVSSPFDRDFQNSNHVWQDVCQLDSDGDGLTNGQELGDPDCRWIEGQPPDGTYSISHPGVCDPVNSPICMTKNDILGCNQKDDFKCDAINEKETKSIAIRYPVTKVPNQTTNFFCMLFDLPQDGDYHLVATKPYIDNRYVIKGIVLRGCDESNGPVNVPLDTPQPCGTSDDLNCASMISLWGVGLQGDCLQKDTGIRFGAVNGYKKAILQFHWMNTELKSDYTDSSGMTLFYTPVLRKYDVGILMTGPEYLKIPPKQERVVQTGLCTPECTQRITGIVNITRAIHHMHHLGREMKIELWRNGSKVTDISNGRFYSYDSLVTVNFENAIQLYPGDEIKTICVYSSKDKNKYTYYGIGPQDEMCYGFLSYYPVHNMPLPMCTSWKSLSKCKIWFDPERLPVRKGCTLNNTSHSDAKALIEDIMNTCRSSDGCSPGCLEKLKMLSLCRKDFTVYVQRQFAKWDMYKMKRLFEALDSCKL